MSEEKWNQFTVTGSVRDYLAYCACVHAQEARQAGHTDVSQYENIYENKCEKSQGFSQERMT